MTAALRQAEALDAHHAGWIGVEDARKSDEVEHQRVPTAPVGHQVGAILAARLAPARQAAFDAGRLVRDDVIDDGC